MPGGTAARTPPPAVLALAVLPVLFHLAIVATGHVRLTLTPSFGGLFKLGFVTASAVTHWGIYFGLLLSFALTLRRGREPLITAMARRLHGDISNELALYTRRVTIAWCGFFACQLLTSITLFCFAPLVVWSFFVNILDIPLVAAMFAAEYFVRLRCLRDPPRHSLAAILTMVADVRKPQEGAGRAVMLGARDDVRTVEQPAPGENVYPIARHDNDDDIVARRAGRAITRGMFLRDTAALAARLPQHAYMLNLCTDRYRFMVGFAAALCRKQISLLPPSDAPGVLQAVAADYPDLYALTDTLPAALPGLAYPDDLDGGDAPPGPSTVLANQPAIILFTSGSTGRPKPVPKSWGPLVRSARAAGARLGISRLGGGTVIGTVPHQHSYGFESIILLALQNGLAVDAVWPLYPADIRAAIEQAPAPRILVTAPIHIRALAAEPGGMTKLDLILSATAPLPAPLAAQAEACFGAKLIEIYGCTEAGQVATRRAALDAPWHCLDGVELVQDADRSWASGASVEGTALLHDVIEQTGAGTFRLGGRSADLIDVAGKRTSLAYLHYRLLSIEGVEDGVFFMQDQDERRTPRLAAVVVAPGVAPDAIMRALRAQIDRAFLPRPLVLVDALPRNALGKLPREALLRLVRRPENK